MGTMTWISWAVVPSTVSEGASNDETDVDNEAWNKPNTLDAALQFLSYFYLDHIVSAVINKTLSKIQEGCTEFAQYAL